MSLITKEVKIKLIPKTIKWYGDKGYTIPRYIDKQGKNKVHKGTEIIVKVEDLLDGSHVLVDIKCDGCEKELIGVKWQQYLKYVKENGKYYC